MSEVTRCSRRTPLGAIGQGLLASAIGITAMDVLWYYRYRRGGGQSLPIDWEFSVGLDDWSNASAPGQVGKRLYEGYFQNELAPSWAAFTQNFMHWAYGLFWGAVLGLVTGAGRPPRVLSGLLFGSVVWLASYVFSLRPRSISRCGNTTRRRWPRIGAPTSSMAWQRRWH